MTIREFGVLNRHHVPGRAMTLDAILNILLICAFAGVLEILAVSNVGYVFATCAALSGFLLLRKDRPNWPGRCAWPTGGCRWRASCCSAT